MLQFKFQVLEAFLNLKVNITDVNNLSMDNFRTYQVFMLQTENISVIYNYLSVFLKFSKQLETAQNSVFLLSQTEGMNKMVL